MCRVRCRPLWLATIALLGTVGCSGDSAPPVLTIQAPVAEQRLPRKTAERPASAESVAPQAIEQPQRSAVFIPDTPDGTVRAVFHGLREGHPEVVWDALPASYQRDLNELVHLAANRLNPEAWRWSQKIAGKGARIAKASLEAAPSQNDPTNANEDESIVSNIRALETLATLLDGISICGIEPLERSKTVDLGDILRSDGQTLLSTITNLTGLLGDGFPDSLKQSLQISVNINEIAGDSAVLEIENLRANTTTVKFVRVEGKWIPSWLAEQWSGGMETARRFVYEIFPSEIANENFGSSFQALTSIDMQVDELLRQLKHRDAEPDSLSDEFSVLQALMLLGYWIGGPPAIESDFHKKTKNESLSAKGNVTLVYCFAPKFLKVDIESVDYDLAKHVTYQLNANKIKVVDPDRFNAWLGKNGNGKKPSEIGATFKVDYVVHIDLADFTLFEYHSESLMRGRAGCTVSVIKMNEDRTDGDVIYTHSIKSSFPIRGPVDSRSMPLDEFKKRYLSFLSDEIARLFHSGGPQGDLPSAADSQP